MVDAEIGSYQEAVERIWGYGETHRTWGKWGINDERGAVNYITAESRVRAAQLVRRGAVFSLALPIRSGKGPQTANIIGRFNPIHHLTYSPESESPHIDLGAGTGMNDDLLVIGCHSSTHWDALSHNHYKGKMYNNFDAAEVNAHGARRNGIDKVHREFVGRGVLLDIARLKGVDVLEPGYSISSADLAECAENVGVVLGEGDILLIRTGMMTLVSGDDWSGYHSAPRSGLHYTTAEWLGQNKVAAVASDTGGVEAPSPLPGINNPLHMIALRDMGIHLGEFWYLEELADDCARDGVHEFMLAAQALPIEGGIGSPVNPIAIK
jgi:kynurenine formamidase